MQEWFDFDHEFLDFALNVILFNSVEGEGFIAKNNTHFHLFA